MHYILILFNEFLFIIPVIFGCCHYLYPLKSKHFSLLVIFFSLCHYDLLQLLSLRCLFIVCSSVGMDFLHREGFLVLVYHICGYLCKLFFIRCLQRQFLDLKVFSHFLIIIGHKLYKYYRLQSLMIMVFINKCCC